MKIDRKLTLSRFKGGHEHRRSKIKIREAASSLDDQHRNKRNQLGSKKSSLESQEEGERWRFLQRARHDVTE